jgi:uncharacterized damage-inducible protein DinB
MLDPRYPIGRHDPLAPVSADDLAAAIADIAALPERLRDAVSALDDRQLDTPYREGGWTVRQVVHHVADSHLNAYVRCRLALTEERPTISTYEEGRWAELPDARDLPPEPSLALLAALHERWSSLLAGLSPQHFERPLVHPDIGPLSLAQLVCLYGWHSRHHVAHVTELARGRGW